jgi:hypothetical protein
VTLFSGQLANSQDLSARTEAIPLLDENQFPDIEIPPYFDGLTPEDFDRLNNADTNKDGKLNNDELLGRRRRGANHAYGGTSQVKFWVH